MGNSQQALHVIELLYRLSRSMIDDLREHVTAVANLEVGEFVLLRAIAAGTSSPSELSRDLSSHPAATSRTLTQLVRAGLVERHTNPDDSRRLEVTLTDQGQAVTQQIAARIRPTLQRRLDLLAPGDTDQLIATLEHLLAAKPPR